MPQYTNRLNLPKELCDALSKNRYSGDSEASTVKTDFSITSLIAPTQQVILKKRYPDCESIDYVDNLWSMFGSIAHQLLEEHGADNAEQRFYATVNDKTISGGIDHYKDGVVTDYKVTSVWKVAKKNYDEWSAQLNCYAWLLGKSNLPVHTIRIIAILRDWSEPDGYKPDYPKAPIEIINIPLWSEQEASFYITERVGLLNIDEKLADEDLTPCSEVEMWCTPSKWAVMKDKDSKRATRVFDTEKEALDFGSGIVVKREGERRRCAKYCQVASRCCQYQKYLEGLNGKSECSDTIF